MHTDQAYADALERLVSRIGYKPAWRMATDYHPKEDVVNLVLVFVTTNADRPPPLEPDPCKIGRVSAFPVMCYDLWVAGACEWEAYTLHWIAGRIEALEIHESHEWLRVDGERLKATGHPPDVRGLTP